jgi:hypothetical protein
MAMPSFCVIKKYNSDNYHGMAVSNTMVIYHGISTLEIVVIFITLSVNYCSILTLEKVRFFTVVIYRGIFISLATGAKVIKQYCGKLPL